MTTKIIVLTSSFDWESVQLDQFNELITLEHGIRELIRTRIDRAQVPYENRHQIILPAKHPLTRNIIRVYHMKHCGTNYVLEHLRQQFWVINGREEVKCIGRECPECRREREPSLQGK